MTRAASRSALDLWMNGEYVGVWDQRGDVQTLRYDPTWNHSPRGRPLSLSLPLLPDGEAHRGKVVEAWFENLLPDNKAIRRRIRQHVGARSTSAFDLLSEIGRDCAGALQIVAPGEEPPSVRAIIAEPLDEHAVAQVLRRVPAVGDFGERADGDEFRISLAGAQEKTALTFHGGEWCIPRGSTPTTHLFKLPLGLVGHMRADFSSSVENEWLCSELVRALGLAVATARVAMFEDQKALVVERFDRRLASDGQWWQRLPQEDLCQAKGLPPERKYERDGGPGIAWAMDLLRRSESADADRETFFQAQLVFWLLAATDGHAKNFSLFLGPKGSFRMTPLYDILSAYPVMGRGANRLDPRKAGLAMAIVSKNRHYLLSEVQPRHWPEMARRCGIDGQAIVQQTLARVPGALETTAAVLPAGFPAFVSDPIFEGVRRAAARLAAG